MLKNMVPKMKKVSISNNNDSMNTHIEDICTCISHFYNKFTAIKYCLYLYLF